MDVLLVDEIRETDHSATEDSDSESEDVGLPRLGVAARFLKRTYGVADSSLEQRCKSARLDEQLDGLRAVLPDVAAMSKERKNVIVDAYHYIAALQRQVENLNAELREDDHPLNEQLCEWSMSCLRELPIVDIARVDGLLEVRVACANRPRLLVDVMEAIESRGFTIMQARIACHSEVVVEYLTLENEDPESLKKADSSSGHHSEEDELKAMLMLVICKQEFSQDDVDDLQ